MSASSENVSSVLAYALQRVKDLQQRMKAKNQSSDTLQGCLASLTTNWIFNQSGKSCKQNIKVRYASTVAGGALESLSPSMALPAGSQTSFFVDFIPRSGATERDMKEIIDDMIASFLGESKFYTSHSASFVTENGVKLFRLALHFNENFYDKACGMQSWLRYLQSSEVCIGIFDSLSLIINNESYDFAACLATLHALVVIDMGIITSGEVLDSAPDIVKSSVAPIQKMVRDGVPLPLKKISLHLDGNVNVDPVIRAFPDDGVFTYRSAKSMASKIPFRLPALFRDNLEGLQSLVMVTKAATLSLSAGDGVLPLFAVVPCEDDEDPEFDS